MYDYFFEKKNPAENPLNYLFPEVALYSVFRLALSEYYIFPLCGYYEKSLIVSILSLRKGQLILPFYATFWKRQTIRTCSLHTVLHLLTLWPWKWTFKQ